MSVVPLQGSAAITPGLSVPDRGAAYWLEQVNLRLRREVSWCWHQRVGRTDPLDGALPPVTDACVISLDQIRFRDQKQRFLSEDVAGKHLTNCLENLTPPDGEGIWADMVRDLCLNDADQFVLALGLAQRLDAGLAPVFASCMNDLTRPYPTLALAQRLWDDPGEVVSCASADWPLAHLGLIRRADPVSSRPDWLEPLEVPSLVAEVLAGLTAAASAGGLFLCGADNNSPLDERLTSLAWRLACAEPSALEVIPLHGVIGADFDACAAQLVARGKRSLFRAPDWIVANREVLAEFSTISWLAGGDLLLPESMLHSNRWLDAVLPRSITIPVRWFLPIHDCRDRDLLPPSICLPEAKVPMLSYDERRRLLLTGLGHASEHLSEAVDECARRFRLQTPAVRRVTESLKTRPLLDAETLVNACRVEAESHLDHLAQRVTPRFSVSDLVLPPGKDRQFDEVLCAMRALTRVHYQWGTARVWNESGLSVLFYGPPGTGKTMGAEALADALALDLYRIDLSQVVNKYIGETEKNLRRIFDAAEASDCILFFDEADALFGKRTEVKDAHDRFANIEISYLLERMERLKGLAILATNRRKDLDEAFMRRLRYVIEFPLPGPAERERIWQTGFPKGVDTDELDFHYLGKQFALSGGNIRSVIFNACLQAAHKAPQNPLPNGKVGRVKMADVLVQVKRELEKMNRASGEEQFGAYAGRMKEWVG